MKALIDTNILIHRETKNPVVEDIGTLFYWLGKLKYTTCIHPITQAEILSNKNQDAVKAFAIKMRSYELLREPKSLDPSVQKISNDNDVNQNDINDSKILNEVFCERVDIFITEDKKIHKKAAQLGIGQKIYTVSSFLERVKEEVPGLVDYDILEIRKKNFIDIDINDPFFDTFRQDYPEFNSWFNRKSSEEAYVMLNKSGGVEAFLYLKVEDRSESYSDITPKFELKKRLKIGTLKVTKTGMRLGERFLKITFDNARANKADEIYVTVFENSDDKRLLVAMLNEWGFENHGYKEGNNRQEQVLTKKMKKDTDTKVDRDHPKKTYPLISQAADFYMLSIMPEYHTDLFPDSILFGEDAGEFIDSSPHRNAISKSYVSSAPQRELKSGDVIVFYRTGGNYKGVATTIGLVEGIVTEFKDVEEFLSLTRKRTVFSESELRNYYNSRKNRSPEYRAFIINFLYVGTIPKGKRPNLKELRELNIIDSAPRGIVTISKEAFKNLYERM